MSAVVVARRGSVWFMEGIEWRLVVCYSFSRERRDRAVDEVFTNARIMRDVGSAPQWAKWRTRSPNSNANQPPPSPGGTFDPKPAFVPPNADSDSRLHVEFLQDVLHVLLHGAGAASKNLADFSVALPGCDPFDDLELALRQGARRGGSGWLYATFC
jgi:hypothetical protein